MRLQKAERTILWQVERRGALGLQLFLQAHVELDKLILRAMSLPPTATTAGWRMDGRAEWHMEVPMHVVV